MKTLQAGLLLLTLCGLPALQAATLSTGEVLTTQRGGEAPTTAVKTVRSSGTIAEIDHDGGYVTIAHPDIPELGLPAMRSTFAVRNRDQLAPLRPRQNVHFTLDDSGRILVIHPVP